MKIGIDIDGVIRDFFGKTEEVYFRKYPSHKLIRRDVYDISLWFPIGKEIYKFAFETHAKEIYTQSLLYENALDFMIKLRKNNRVILVTNQPEKKLEGLTKEWLEIKDIPYDELIFTKDKSEFIGDCLLDDHTANLERVARVGNSKPICFDRPWNQDWKGPRVKSYDEFLELIK
ncbi:hypothetical protein J4437_08085 [Candidatus Woesearchaeota archaeon]|nr:hypothetical protein [Candidatus Woesearchaeota archaeon]